jgi:hypothetical protein
MSKLLTYNEFVVSKIKSFDEISDIEDVLPDESVVEEPTSGRIFSFDDYYKNGTVSYPNHTIKKTK